MLLAYLKSRKQVLCLKPVINEETQRISIELSGAFNGEVIITATGAIVKADSEHSPSRLLVLEIAPILRSNVSYLAFDSVYYISVIDNALTLWRATGEVNEVRDRTTINLDTHNAVNCDESEDLCNLAIMIAIS